MLGMVRRGRGGHREPAWSAGRGGVSHGSGEMGRPEASSVRVGARWGKEALCSFEAFVSRGFVEVVIVPPISSLDHAVLGWGTWVVRPKRGSMGAGPVHKKLQGRY